MKRLTLALCLAAAATACGPSKREVEERAMGVADSVVVARVNGRPIYMEDLTAEAIAQGRLREGEAFDPTNDAYFQVLEDLIETKLLAIEAEARGLDRTVEARRRLDIARERILAGVLYDEIAANALKESAIERMYREQVKLLKVGKEVRGRHILLDSEQAALTAKGRLETGELFETLALELSLDRTTAGDGGDLGYFFPDAMPDPIRAALQEAPVGQIVGPVRSDQGWHLFKLEERRESAPPSRESLRPKIVQWLMFEEQRQLIEKLRDSARIERPTAPAAGRTPETVVAPTPPPPQTPPQAPPEQVARPLERET